MPLRGTKAYNHSLKLAACPRASFRDRDARHERSPCEQERAKTAERKAKDLTCDISGESVGGDAMGGEGEEALYNDLAWAGGRTRGPGGRSEYVAS